MCCIEIKSWGIKINFPCCPWICVFSEKSNDSCSKEQNMPFDIESAEKDNNLCVQEHNIPVSTESET